MGSMISLGVGTMEIDWGKNNCINFHSDLFQPEDVKQIPYYYVDDENSYNTEYKEGYSRKLSSVKQRLNLLGYTLKTIKTMYNEMVEECENHCLSVALSYENFSKLLKEIDVNKINTLKYEVEYDENGYDLGEFARRCIIPEEEIHSKLFSEIDEDEYNVTYDLEVFFENMNPYIILRLLAENPNASDLDVYWSFADVVENGWVTREKIVHPLCDSEKIIIVTEGSSDSYIIQKTIESIYPDISDFFKFIDMENNYPFTGTGNLYNFCCGLMKLGVNNKIIVIFDNDTEGNEKYLKLVTMPKMDNFLITKLPDYHLFEHISTLGPQGENIENINGTAVAIECFLDFNSCNREAKIRWTSYNEKLKKYQGALVCKDDYIRAFKKAKLLDGTYDTTKLKFLIDYLLNEWINR